MKVFFAGVAVGCVALLLGCYIFIWLGGMPVATSSSPLPFEKLLAHTALHAAYRGAEKLQSPLPATEANYLAGAKLYKSDCSFCHGLPNQEDSNSKLVFFPPPPQLFHHGVADDPIGETYLKIKNGIRLSAMPAFVKTYSEDQLWQVSLLLFAGKKLSPEVLAELAKH